MRYYFFLSYARGDEDELIQRFYQDLSTEVRLRAGRPRGDVVGFVDRTLRVGERWPRRLSEALGTSGCFLALMTPRYFTSQPCGREWMIFAQRAARYEAIRRVDSSLLKPLMWVPTPPTKMHPIAGPIQYYSPTLGDLYQRLGVRQLMRLGRHRDDYVSFVFELSEQIVESVESHPIPDADEFADFNQIPSAFHEATPAAPIPADQSLLVHFVVATSARADMAEIRGGLHIYGERARDWAPYDPALPVPLAEYALGIATEHSFVSRVADVRELARWAEQASRRNQIVVLLVDAWGPRLPATRQPLVAHNALVRDQQRPITAVLIPSSQHDRETRTRWADLSAECRVVLDHLANDDELYRAPVPTHHLFRLELPEVLEVAKNRVYRSGQVNREPGPDVDPRRPRLDGPSTPDTGPRPDDDLEEGP